jgi:hypothetical protein
MPSPQFFLEVQNGMICTLDASTSTATATELGSTEIILMDKSKSLWEYMLKKNKVDWFIEIKPLKYGGKKCHNTYTNNRTVHFSRGPSWSYGSWIYNCLCNQSLSLLTLWVWIPIRQSVPDKTLCDKGCQWQVSGFLLVLQFPPPIKLTTTT